VASVEGDATLAAARGVGPTAPEKFRLGRRPLARRGAVIVAQDSHGLLDGRVAALLLHRREPESRRRAALSADGARRGDRRWERLVPHQAAWKSKSAKVFSFLGMKPARVPEWQCRQRMTLKMSFFTCSEGAAPS
jgi:hypothetical protein